MNPRRALIIFAKLPRPGEVKTRLGAAVGMEKAAALYERFAQHAFEIGEGLVRSGVGVYLFYEGDEQAVRTWVAKGFMFVKQSGRSLGDRMLHAFHFVFDNGVGDAIIIGTDIPELQGEKAREAFQLLSSHDVVIGPSSDGGYYLLGMKAPAKDLFEGIRWSTENVFEETARRIHDLQLSLSVLPVLADVDTVQDYEGFLARRTKP